MSFPRDAILGTGFAPQGRACPIAPDARPIYNKREAPPIRTIGDLLRTHLPHLWPQIQANCAKIRFEERPIWDSLDTPRTEALAASCEYPRRLLASIFDWAATPEGYEFWMNECGALCPAAVGFTHDS